jgi:hypothetical protein
MKAYAAAVLFTLSSICSFAQNKDQKGTSAAGLKFSSVPVVSILGEDTSYQNALSISPFLVLRSKKGWGISYSPSMITSGQRTGLYMHSLSGGYERYGDKSFDLAFNYTHHFFTNKTSVPYTSLNNEIYFSLAYSKTWLKPSLSASIGFGRDSNSLSSHDIGLATGVSHDMSWDDVGLFSSIDVSPSVMLNAGTNGSFSFLQTSAYLSHNRHFVKYVKKHGRGGSTKAGFDLSNVELTIEASLEIGAFSLHPTGAIVFPLHSGSDQNVFGYGELSFQYAF